MDRETRHPPEWRGIPVGTLGPRMPEPPISGVRPVLARVCWALAWAFVAALGLTTVFRLAAWDKFEVFAILDAFTLTLFLPAWPIAVIAAWRRHWLLFAAAGAMVVTHIVLVAPEILASTSLPLWRADPRCSVSSMPTSTRTTRPWPATPARSVSTSPTSSPWKRPRRATYSSSSPVMPSTDCATCSRTMHSDHAPWSSPVATRWLPSSSRRSTVSSTWRRTVVTIGTRRLALWVVHTTAPIDPGVGQWNDELDGVVRMLRTDRPRPLLLLGDFNATWGNRGFRAILSTGLTDGAAARGQDFDMTWSQMTSPLPPMVRIDHVLTGPGVEVTAIHTEPGPGSDHRALAATVAVLGIRSAPR